MQIPPEKCRPFATAAASPLAEGMGEEMLQDVLFVSGTHLPPHDSQMLERFKISSSPPPSSVACFGTVRVLRRREIPPGDESNYYTH
jgi:hypothetical protein